MFLRKGVLKICNKFTGEHPCRSVISIKMLCNFIGLALWNGYFPVNLLHTFRPSFPRNTSGRLLLVLASDFYCYQEILNSFIDFHHILSYILSYIFHRILSLPQFEHKEAIGEKNQNKNCINGKYT